MKKSYGLLLTSLLLIVSMVLVTACGKKETTETPEVPTPDPVVEEPALSVSDVVGNYEGEWAMSPNMKPLTSLVLTNDGKYELYISIMGLVEEGTFNVNGADEITFTSSTAVETVGKYDTGVVTAAFSLDGSPVDFQLSQVGNPDDVYATFLGTYKGTVMGSTEVNIMLLPGSKYVNALSQEEGTFKIYNGEITLTPNDGEAVVGVYDVSKNEMTLTMSVMPGTPTTEITFSKETAEEASEPSGKVFVGTSAVGMSGSTEVKLIMQENNSFVLETTKPRGTGTYEIKTENGVSSLVLTFTDPAAKPDGSPFVLTGVMTSEDLFAAGNEVTFATIEYLIDMNGTKSVMDLGEVTFTLAP